MENNNVNYELLDELDPNLMRDLRNCRGKWVPFFKEFLDGDQPYAVISFGSAKERTSCISSLISFKKRYNLDFTYGNYGPGIKIYLAKAKHN